MPGRAGHSSWIEYRKRLPILSASMTGSAPKPPGRPRVVPLESLRLLRSLSPDIHTDRQHQNRAYAHTAMRILGLLPDAGKPATWLVDWEGADRGKQGAVKWSVLEQLGRMSKLGFDDVSIRNFAAVIEEQRMNAKDAAARLRNARLHALRDEGVTPTG